MEEDFSNRAKALGGETTGAAADRFRDKADIPAWALSSVAAAADAGILSGVGNDNFRPGGTVTRAETVAAVHKLLEALHQ